MTKKMNRLEALLRGFSDKVSLEFQKKRINRKLEAKKDELDEKAYDINNELNEAFSKLVSNPEHIGDNLTEISSIFSKRDENKRAQEQLEEIKAYLSEEVEINEEDFDKK